LKDRADERGENMLAVYRFMSAGELQAFQRGERVCSPRYGGSYFLPLFGEWKPYDAYRFLDGLVTEDVCGVFLAPPSAFEDRLAPYADPAFGAAWDDQIEVSELFAVGGYSAADGFRFIGVLPAPYYDSSPEGELILGEVMNLIENLRGNPRLQAGEEVNSVKGAA